MYKCHPNCKKEEWGALTNLSHHWSSLCVEGILFPSHNVSSFLCNPKSSNFDPVANLVSIVNLVQDATSSLLQALAYSHPDCEVWLQSYYEGKTSIEDMGTIERITLG